jgi:C4-dicarboxylate-specific signal transduction histidine kinase
MRASAAVLASAVVLGAGGAIAGAATPAATPQSLSGIQAKAAAAVSLRVNDLNAAIAKVNADPRLGSDSAALAAYLQARTSPVQPIRSM